MRFDALVDTFLFRGIMLGGSALIFWVLFVAMPREFIRRRRSGNGFDAESALRMHWGDAPQAAAAARSAFPALVGLFATAVQLLAMAVMGSALGFGDWIYWGQALAIVGAWILVAREVGWPNILVPKELRGEPGLMRARLQAFRNRGGPAEEAGNGAGDDHGDGA
jgi:hypothetical protein